MTDAATDIIPAPSFAVVRLLDDEGNQTRRRPLRIEFDLGLLPRAVVIRSGAPGRGFADGEVLDGQTVLLSHLGYPASHHDDDLGIRIVSIDHIVAVVRRPTAYQRDVGAASAATRDPEPGGCYHVPRCRLHDTEIEKYAEEGSFGGALGLQESADVEAMATELLHHRKRAPR